MGFFSNKRDKISANALYTMIINRVNECKEDKHLFPNGAPIGYELVLFALYCYLLGALNEVDENVMSFTVNSLRQDMRTLKYPLKEISRQMKITQECSNQIKHAYTTKSEKSAQERVCVATLELLGLERNNKNYAALYARVDDCIKNGKRYVYNCLRS